MFSAHPIGFIHSPYRESSTIPKGLGAKHDAEGVIELLREFEPDFFFDDQTGHIERASKHVPSGHVVSGLTNDPR